MTNIHTGECILHIDGIPEPVTALDVSINPIAPNEHRTQDLRFVISLVSYVDIYAIFFSWSYIVHAVQYKYNPTQGVLMYLFVVYRDRSPSKLFLVI